MMKEPMKRSLTGWDWPSKVTGSVAMAVSAMAAPITSASMGRR